MQRRVRYTVFVVAAAVAIIAGFVIATASTLGRRERIQDQIQANKEFNRALCGEVRVINGILIEQLGAAKQRVLVSIPKKNNPIRREQLAILNEGIRDLSSGRCKV